MLSVVVLDVRTAGFDRLDRLARVAAGTVDALARDRADVAGVVLVATCNRFETYLDVSAPSAATAIGAAVARAAGLDPADLAAHARVLHGHDVAEHLFAVASGLESVVVGEAEISGQVARALESARAAGTTTPDLERLFQRAAQASAAAHHGSTLPATGRTLVRVALDLVSTRIGDWTALRVLLVGTGSYAAVTLAALRERGVRTVAVHSPSGNASRLSDRTGVRPLAAAELAPALGTADLVVTCTVTPAEPVLTAADLDRARRTHQAPDGAIVVDLGLPRNVDPAVAGLPGVDLLDLQTLALHATLPQLQAADDAYAVLRDALADYRAAQAATAVAPVVVALRAHVQQLVDGEIARLRRRGESSPAAERALRHLGSALVHTPSVRAREHAATGDADDFIRALATVHGLGPAAPTTGARAGTA